MKLKYGDIQFSGTTSRKTEGYKQINYYDYIFGSNTIKGRSYTDANKPKYEFTCNLDDDSLFIYFLLEKFIFDFKLIIENQ